MMLRRLASAALVLTVLAPVLASGLPACCAPVEAPRSCCPSNATAQAPKGCCKAPEAPRPEARSKTDVALATVASSPVGPAAASCVATVPSSVSFLRARLDGRAPSPADSPPDLPTLHRTLLI